MPDDAATVEDLQKAKDNNQDGVIIENVRDYGPNDEERMNWETNEFATYPTTDYIIFTPNQIKSATDNIGTFSTENDDIQMFIGKRARSRFEQQLRKARPDMSDDEIKSTLDFLHSLEDSKENSVYIKTAIRWIANRSLTLPQDHEKAYQVFELARKRHIDIQKYRTVGELIVSPEM